MNLLTLLRRVGSKRLQLMVLAALGSALSSTLILVVVNAAAADIAAQEEDFVDLCLAGAFLAVLVTYMASETWMVSQMASLLEEAIDGMRCSLVDKVRCCDLLKLERFGPARLFESITQAGQVISQNSEFLAISLRSVLSIIAVMAYIAVLSPLAFFMISAVLGGGSLFYVRLGKSLQRQQDLLAVEETALFEGVSDLFDGFKEQRLNSARSNDLNATFITMSDRTMTARGRVHMHTWQQFITGEMAFNLMLGVVVFVIPTYSRDFADQVVKVAAAILFLATPVFSLMQSLAVMTAANNAAGRMISLEEELDDLAENDGKGPPVQIPGPFSQIRLDGVSFSFAGQHGDPAFTTGPFSVTFRRGEVVFITGGNGSGKSTFIKLLTGLYHPPRGRVMMDDVTIGPRERPAFREHMATVFADFHLFARLYGLGQTDPQETERLMQWMEMHKIAHVDEDRFSSRDLSAGQRKRLGLIAALLEHKPVLILDEWAADQDPHFRQKFYREIIPALKEQGITLIAVTHDDQYFDVADHRLHMEDGQLYSVPVGAGWHPPAPDVPEEQP